MHGVHDAVGAPVVEPVANRVHDGQIRIAADHDLERLAGNVQRLAEALERLVLDQRDDAFADGAPQFGKHFGGHVGGDVDAIGNLGDIDLHAAGDQGIDLGGGIDIRLARQQQ